MVEAGLPHKYFLASEMPVAEMVREKVCGVQARTFLSSSRTSTTIAASADDKATSTDTNSSSSGGKKETNRPRNHARTIVTATAVLPLVIIPMLTVVPRRWLKRSATLQTPRCRPNLGRISCVAYMENEDSRRGHEPLLYEWKEVQNGICMLHAQLERKNIDNNRTKQEADLLNDRERLLRSLKDELAEKLRFVRSKLTLQHEELFLIVQMYW